METHRLATAPGKKYPSYDPTKGRIWWILMVVILFAAAAGTALLGSVGRKDLVMILVPATIVVCVLFFLIQRTRGHLNAVTFTSDGFGWRGVLHAWTDLQAVEQEELSADFVSVKMWFIHENVLIERKLVIYRKRDPQLLVAELRSVLNGNQAGDVESRRSHGGLGDVSSAHRQESP